MRPRKTWTLNDLPKINVTDNLDSVLKGLDPKHLAILVGAGVSVAGPSGLPSASQFLRAFYEVCLPPSCDRDLFLSASSDLRFEMVLGLIQHEFDEDLGILDVFLGAEPNQNHSCLSELARQGAIVITTNFDSLIEQASAGAFAFKLRATESDFKEVPAEKNKNADAVPEFWHLHGVIEDPSSKERRSESIVASIRDCWSSKDLFRLDMNKGRMLSNALADRDLLVLGYSGSDDYDIAPALEEIHSKRRLVWVHHTPPGEEFDLLGVNPLVTDYLEGYQQGGKFWYRASCVNSLATMVGNGARSAARVHLLRSETGAVLRRLSGLSYEGEQGSTRQDRGVLSSLRSRFDKLRGRGGSGADHNSAIPKTLKDHFTRWRDKHSADLLSRYFLAILICNSGGLYEEEDRLLQEAASVQGELLKAGSTDERLIRSSFYISLRAAEYLSGNFGNYDPQILYSQANSEFIKQQPYLKANLLTSHGRIDQDAGRIDQAISNFQESLRVRRSVSFLRDIEVAEYDLAHALFLKGYDDKDLLAAETQAKSALETSRSASHPEGIARALLLLARVYERLDKTPEAEAHYHQASEAAYRTGDERLIAESYGELGFFLWTRVSNLRIDKVKEIFDKTSGVIIENAQSGPLGGYPTVIESMATGLWRMIDIDVVQQMRPKYRETCEQAASYFAEAFRIHSRHKDYGALLQISANLSECFEFLGKTEHALLADCTAYQCSLVLNNQETAGMSFERVQTGAEKVFPTTAFKARTEKEYVASVHKALLEQDILI